MLNFDNANNVKAFKAKTEDEVIKVKDCTFANEIKDESRKFFFCPCSSKDCSPICQACASKCHADHKPSVFVEGIYECKCGVNNHVISEKLENYFKENSKEISKKCFYFDFFKYTLNLGYYKREDLDHDSETKPFIICCLCKDNCSHDDEKFIPVKNPENKKCMCDNHFEENILNINQDLLKPGIDFRKYILNFNYNLIDTVASSQKIYSQFIREKIEDYGKKAKNNNDEKKNNEEAKRLFKDFFLFNLLILFDELTIKYKSKFTLISNFLGSDKQLVIKLFNEPLININENDAKDLSKTKFLLGNIIFSIFSNSFLLKHNNLFNCSSILNMNVFQRELYLLEARNFFKHHIKTNEEEKEKIYFESLLEFHTYLLDAYEEILKINESYDIFEEIKSLLFKIFNKIFTKLIKYNFISDEIKMRYFELVLDTISIYNDKDCENFSGNSYYIIKSILYTLLHKNDKICLMKMRGESFVNEKDKTFVFVQNEDSNTIAKIFTFILIRYGRNHKPLRLLKYDFFVQKIMELMIGENDFYKMSLDNLLTLPIEDIKIALNHNLVYNSLNRILFDKIRNIGWSLSDLNIKYNEFKIKFSEYIEKISQILEQFHQLIKDHCGEDLPNFKKIYEVYPEMCSRDMTKIKEIQNCVKYSTILSQINHCLNIYSQTKIFYQSNKIDLKKFTRISSDLLNFLLQFFFVIIDKNYENICLLMSFEDNEWYNTFIDVKETFFKFLLVMSEMMFSSSLQCYKFDNYKFFCNIISFIAKNLTFEDNLKEKEYYENLSILHNLFKIFSKAIKHVKPRQGEIIDTLEYLLDVTKNLAKNQKLNDSISTYLKSRNTQEITLNSKPKYPTNIIEKLIKNYFKFANELIYEDLYFLGIFKEENFLISFELIEEISKEPEKFKLPVLIEIEVLRFFKLIYFRNGIRMKNTFEMIENYFKLDIYKNTELKNIVNYDVRADREKFKKTYQNEDGKISKFDVTLYKIINSTFVMIKSLKRFEKNLKNIILSVKSPLSRKLKLLYYFEYCIVRPFYILLNLYIKNKSIINGDSSYSYYEMAFYFLKCVVYFYENVNSSNLVIDEEEAAFNRKIMAYDFKEILVNQDLEGSVLEQISDDIILLKDEFIKYFQLNCIYEICITNIHKIIKSGDNNPSPEENEEDMYPRMKSPLMKSEGMNLVSNNAPQRESKLGFILDYTNLWKKKVDLKAPEITKIEKIIEKYKKCVEKYSGDSLAFIKILEVTDSDYDCDLRKIYLDYLQNKLADGITSFYLNFESNFVYNQFSEITFDSFKFQNSYCIFYINALFTHDSEGFQECLSEQHSEEEFHLSEKKFLKFIIYYLIFSNSINEVSRLDELDFSDGKSSFGYSLCTISIKFIQNLCEGHNVTFQNQFFDYAVFCKTVKQEPSNLIEEKDKISSNSNKKLLINNKNEEELDKQSNDVDAEEKEEEEKVDDESEKSEIDEAKNNAEKEKNEKEIKLLEENKVFSFLNFVSGSMRIINKNLKKSLIKNYDCILEIYQRYTDLIIEMIQGTDDQNFDNFYKKVKDYEAITNEGKINEKKLIFFQFIQLINEIKFSMFDEELILDKLSLKIKSNLFSIIINLINGSTINQELIKILVFVFDPDKLIDLISKYLRSLYIKHIANIDYDHLNFKENFQNLELNKECFDQLYQTFKVNAEFYEDEFFQLTGQLFLFLTILGERYGINEAQKALFLYKKDLQVPKVDDKISNLKPIGIFFRLKSWIYDMLQGFKIEEANNKINERFKKKQKFNINNMIIASKFYNKIIRSCEFVIGEEQKLKKLYFIIDPKVYLISKRNIEAFFEEVDRSSSTTKLKSFLDQLNLFCLEVEYKEKHLKNSVSLKRMLEIDYKNADLMNFFFALLINIILILFLDNKSLDDGYVFNFIMIIAIAQIIANLVYLSVFLSSKYDYYLSIERSKINEKKLSIWQWISIRLDSFIFNDEIYIVILNTVVGLFAVFYIHYTFLFTLQLLTIIKFVDTIKEIVIAFKIRIGQLLSMIGFLVILIYFYSNIGFYYFADEFNMTMDNGVEENICGSLIQCAITYFNNGVRSGGGIGDLLSMKPFSDVTNYAARYLMDMIFYITVILLLLNMINGVIVSTFSQIREESNNKEEDKTNKCFICSIDRVEFEKKKIAFKDHLKYEHNSKTYIKYLVFLKLFDEKDLDADQSHIITCLKERDIGCFPVEKSLSLGDLENESDGSDED